MNAACSAQGALLIVHGPETGSQSLAEADGDESESSYQWKLFVIRL